MKYTCAEPGCEVGPRNGDALYRVSPKGTPFIGKCEEHLTEEERKASEDVRLITQTIQEAAKKS